MFFGYTSEYIGDSTDLVYLRARMYAPSTGRFITRDTWDGDYNNPLTLNAWNYTSSNPVNYTDPSGHCTGGSLWDFLFTPPLFWGGPCPGSTGTTPATPTPTLAAIIIATACATPPSTSAGTPSPIPLTVVGFPNITISNPQDWSATEIANLTSILKNEILPAFGNSPNTFANAVGNISLTVKPDYSLAPDMAHSIFVTINFGTTELEHRIVTTPDHFSLIHEIGHHFDWHGYPSNSQRAQWRSQQFVEDPAINRNINQCTADRIQCRYLYADQDYPNGMRPSEAYANAFAAYILGDLSKYQAEKYTIIKHDIQSVP